MAVGQYLPLWRLRCDRQIDPRGRRRISPNEIAVRPREISTEQVQVTQAVPPVQTAGSQNRFALEMFLRNVNQRFFWILVTAALFCGRSDYSLAADQIRISVTNFNMSFLPS